MSLVLSPVSGTVVAMESVPDPVFSAGIVGPGVAIDPLRGKQVAVCPLAGTLLKIHPHAFVVVDADGHGALVHLGINTVEMNGEGFHVIAAEGDTIDAGGGVVAWDPGLVADSGRSPVVIVVALDAKPETLSRLAQPSSQVTAGDCLFDWA